MDRGMNGGSGRSCNHKPMCLFVENRKEATGEARRPKGKTSAKDGPNQYDRAELGEKMSIKNTLYQQRTTSRPRQCRGTACALCQRHFPRGSRC